MDNLRSVLNIVLSKIPTSLIVKRNPTRNAVLDFKTGNWNRS